MKTTFNITIGQRIVLFLNVAEFWNKDFSWYLEDGEYTYHDIVSLRFVVTEEAKGIQLIVGIFNLGLFVGK